ncbi:MAG: hypothetical protein Q4G69_07935 [Planctomycetia bacterium]|nr:hypothetical protein [Planctomycetia bacterium]
MDLFNTTIADFLDTAKQMSWFEIGMLICFGFSWPFSIHTMLRTGRTEGKSLLFLLLVMVGYVFGVLHKAFYHLDVVILLYGFLFVVVLADFLICIYLRRKEKQIGQKKADE